MTTTLLLLAMLLGQSARNPDAPEPITKKAPRDLIVMVHGLGRTRHSLAWLGKQFAQRGYDVLAISYPSTRQEIATSADHLRQQLEPRIESGVGRVHFVTHSLGGLVVRAYLQQERKFSLGRVVMLAPPNRGSEIADRLRHNPLYRWATGPAGQQCGTDPNSPPHLLGPVDYEVGIIAGTRSLNPFLSSLIPGKNDGKVSVDRAAVTGMKDLLVVHRSHTFLMRSREVADQSLHFIAHGAFLRCSTAPAARQPAS